MKKTIGLYIHIPFCKKKCHYCDFPSYSGREDEFEAYVTALEQEIFNRKADLQDYEIGTIFFGGGTPTVLSASFLKRLMEAIFKSFHIAPDAEITTEANPGTLDFPMAEALYGMGFNRLSMGVQAWQNHLLKQLGRIHTIEVFIENFQGARQAGFQNINVDLMFALPSQTMEDWVETLEQIIKLSPEHISAYSLIIEEGTPFHKGVEDGVLLPMGEELDRQMYHYAIQRLGEMGYGQYEISNFARAGYESRHNKVYWETTPYLGFGLGAHSYFQGQRFHNTYDLDQYCSAKGELSLLVEEVTPVSREDKIEEYLFLGLRMTKGVGFSEFEAIFGETLHSLFGNTIASLEADGLLLVDTWGIRLSLRGTDLSNLVFQHFLLD